MISDPKIRLSFSPSPLEKPLVLPPCPPHPPVARELFATQRT